DNGRRVEEGGRSAQAQAFEAAPPGAGPAGSEADEAARAATMVAAMKMKAAAEATASSSQRNLKATEDRMRDLYGPNSALASGGGAGWVNTGESAGAVAAAAAAAQKAAALLKHGEAPIESDEARTANSCLSGLATVFVRPPSVPRASVSAAGVRSDAPRTSYAATVGAWG
ncbi:unnamed protein product, partial [Laminaria digitata]